MTSLTFKTWLTRFATDDSAIGDLARDVGRDAMWPDGPERWETYEAYLHDAGAIPEAVDTARRAWALYSGG